MARKMTILLVLIVMVLGTIQAIKQGSMPKHVKVDSPELCAALLQTNGKAFELSVSGTMKIVIPAESEDQAKFLANYGIGLPVETKLNQKFRPIIVDGCDVK